MNKINLCPFCQGSLELKKVKCLQCETEITGSFSMNRFQYFDEHDLYFIEIFLKSEGNIKSVEKELGISYPTVKSRLSSIISKLGHQKNVNQGSRKKDFLEKLSKGEMAFDEVMEKIQKDK